LNPKSGLYNLVQQLQVRLLLRDLTRDSTRN
jgi:hypothetical protein